jgi:DNA polymerase sigma
VANVWFETDFNKVEAKFNTRKDLTKAKLLSGFFNFYGSQFNYEALAIDIKSGTKPFPLRFDMLQRIEREFADHPMRDKIIG